MGNCCEAENIREVQRYESQDMASYRALLRAINRDLDEPPESCEHIRVVLRGGTNGVAVVPPPPLADADLDASARSTTVVQLSRSRRYVSAMKGTRAAVLQWLQHSADEGSEPAARDEDEPATPSCFAGLGPAGLAAASRPAPADGIENASFASPQIGGGSWGATPQPTPPISPGMGGHGPTFGATPPTMAPQATNALDVGAPVDKPGATPMFASSNTAEPRSAEPSPAVPSRDYSAARDAPPPTLTLEQSADLQHLITADQLKNTSATAWMPSAGDGGVRHVHFPAAIMEVPDEEIKHIPLAKLWKQRRNAQLSTSPTLSPGKRSPAVTPGSGPAPSPGTSGGSGGTPGLPRGSLGIARPRTPPSEQPTPSNSSFSDMASAGMTPHVMLGAASFTPY